jgi:hypothetical protein
MKFINLLAILSFIGLAPIASAQATRTWVSGVGDDVNPGSRTAPCRTFAGVLAKTADGGEIDVLDPGSFGAVTITKSITITGLGSEAGIVVSGINGIIINAADDDVVVLRNLNLEGLGNITMTIGQAGVKILRAGAVYIENCRIGNFSVGVEEITSSTTGTQIVVKDSQILECKVAGVSLAPAGGAASSAFIDRSRIEGCQAGVLIADRGKAVLNEAVISFNVAAGIKQTGTGVIESYRNNRIVGNAPDVSGKMTLLKLR